MSKVLYDIEIIPVNNQLSDSSLDSNDSGDSYDTMMSPGEKTRVGVVLDNNSDDFELELEIDDNLQLENQDSVSPNVSPQESNDSSNAYNEETQLHTSGKKIKKAKIFFNLFAIMKFLILARV